MALAFDKRIPKDVAMALIRPERFFGGASSLAEALGVDVMCKEYGDDDDWVGLDSDDYDSVRLDDTYITFELWFPIQEGQQPVITD